MPTQDQGMDPARKAALLTGAGMWETAGSEEAGIRALTLTDGPHGVRLAAGDDAGPALGQSRPATCFPAECATASSWDPGLLEELGRAAGREAAGYGVDVLLGPGLNIKRSPLGGRNFEYFSEDPLLTGALGAAWTRGVQSCSVAASPKHFAANNQETGRMTVDVIVDERTLREIYLRAFETVVKDASPWTVMAAYNRVNGFHAAQDPWLLTRILRGEWGFDGVVVSDWGAVTDRAAALAAGLDLEMPSSSGLGPRELVAGLEAGLVSPEDVDASLDRMRELGRRTSGRSGEAADFHAHDALARRAASSSMVLLKNDGGLLPFTAQASLAVIGELARTPRYQGSGSSRVNPTRLSTPWAALSARVSGASFAPGYSLDDLQPDAGLIEQAVQAAAAADQVAVFLGLPDAAETEGLDRTSLQLPDAQLRLLDAVAQVRPDAAVVLSNGSVVDTAWAPKAAAVLESWLAGQAGGDAVADVLLGQVNPSGKLAETFPRRLEDTPAYGNFPGEADEVRYGEGALVGYRWYDTRKLEPAFPFGHGLSYTQFGYSDLAAAVQDGTGMRVSLQLTNTGALQGAEVVQLYVAAPAGAVPRPEQELRGFQRVDLAPGETRTVTLALQPGSLARFDPTTRSWVTDPGTYEVRAGSSSRDIRLTTAVELTAPVPLPLPTASSTLAEWMHHPLGAAVLGEAFNAAAPGSGETAQLLTLMGSLPLERLGRFPGSPLSADQAAGLARLVAERAGRDHGPGAGS
ncbi:glycoside hydrolase family 3 C-terminal domain-containing protein [Arthrobacter sp. NPDC055585]